VLCRCLSPARGPRGPLWATSSGEGQAERACRQDDSNGRARVGGQVGGRGAVLCAAWSGQGERGSRFVVVTWLGLRSHACTRATDFP
jgi:hypothetical protein